MSTWEATELTSELELLCHHLPFLPHILHFPHPRAGSMSGGRSRRHPGKGQEDSSKLWAFKLRPAQATGLRLEALLSGTQSRYILCEVQTDIASGPVCVASVWGFSVGMSVKDFV